MGDVCLVTGGAGYLGRRVCVALLSAGAREVRSLDLSVALNPVPGVVYIVGDVCSSADVCAAAKGCDVVFHLASFGMSGREMLQVVRTRAVNLVGTQTVLAACKSEHVRRLVYTSSYNAVFGGQQIVNGDENIPPYPPTKHCDEYSRTKALAEQAVLSENSASLSTCALRLAAIYGPGEDRHFPRIASMISIGAFCFSVGPPTTRVDWVHGDSAASAHVLAAEALKNQGPACGQPYFISDNAPVNQTTFLTPLCRALGRRPPRIWLPVWFMLGVAYLIQAVCLLIWRVTGWLPSPILLPAEVLKVGVTHTFSIEKAKKDLGYAPIVPPERGMADTIEAFMATRSEKPKKV